MRTTATCWRCCATCVAGMVDAVREPPELRRAAGHRGARVPDEIPVLHFADALALVGAPADEPDLAPEHERALGEWALAEHGTDFVAVEGYPMAKRPFYTHPRAASDPQLVATASTCCSAGSSWSPAGSGCTGTPTTSPRSRRAARTRPPTRRTSQAFRHGMPPHGGFAIGLERWVARLVGAANVREVTLFPRDLTRLTP